MFSPPDRGQALARELHFRQCMRIIPAFAALVLFAAASRADQDSWFHPEAYRLGGHGGPWAKPTPLDGSAGAMGGGVFGISTNPGFSWIVPADCVPNPTKEMAL